MMHFLLILGNPPLFLRAYFVLQHTGRIGSVSAQLFRQRHRRIVNAFSFRIITTLLFCSFEPHVVLSPPISCSLFLKPAIPFVILADY
jgi:hypothetical protein